MLIFIFLLLSNCIGYLLRYFDIDRHIILMGFRFHLCAVLPFLLLLLKKEFSFIKEKLKVNPILKINGLIVTLIFPLLITTIAYLLEYLKLTDPDYFYEFGLSSVIDYPIYLLWNLPQLLMINLFLLYAVRKIKYSFPVIFLVLIFLFGYEFIPVKEEKFLVSPVLQYALIILFSSLAIAYLKQIYMTSSIIFTIIWSGVLLFGSSSRVIINTFFAKTYESWEGFFTHSKKLPDYLFIYFIGAGLIFFLLYLMVNSFKRKA